MYRIKRLDFNVAYACNLACKGCISLSDFDRRGVVSLNEIQTQCDTWNKIIYPSVISIFGGEPLMHPRLETVLYMIRQAWPLAKLRLITNGYLLKKYDPELWFRFKPMEMQVSIHIQDHEKLITEQIKRILGCRKTWKVSRNTRDGHKQLELTNKELTIYKSKFGRFVMPYKMVDGVPTAFNSDPAKAHKICGNPDVPILYKNKLYKCAPIANLVDIDQRKKFYHYEGLGPNDELNLFVANINKPESLCSMCPEDLNHSVDHFDQDNVTVKNRSLTAL